MNPVQVIEAARPEVGVMPPVERRHLRERIFDVAMRAQSDHVPIDVSNPNTRRSNALRLAALALLGVVAIGGLAYSATRETPGTRPAASSATGVTVAPTITPTRDTVVAAPRPTTAPTTTEPPIAGSPETPLLLPPERNRLDELKVIRAELGASAVLLRGPDLSMISLVEIDGLAPVAPDPADPESVADANATDTTTTTTVAPRQYAAVTVRPPEEQTPGQYRVEVPCGTLTVLDGAGLPVFRPEIEQLFASMRLDGGVIELDLPEGWTTISAGPITDQFLFGLPVEVGDRRVTIEVAQYPNGSLAVAGRDQRQYGPATFNDQPAWIHRDPEDPEAFDLLTIVGTTAIRVSTRDISLAETEAVINGLTPGDVDEWTNRFGTLPVEVDPDIRTCRDQPEFRLASG